ncbi:hypothetical protein Bca52824_077870 [Brassica carinata]|uniref:Histone-lysine N-methyltransferase ASHH4 n=1 Tax=Brassica carinata TaxID=52824 RepID=A0A8X7U0F6_BRACI|nr:hypothetical protein Bca52824_077870 [Brassica carinata]
MSTAEKKDSDLNQTRKGFIKFSKQIGESDELNFIKRNVYLNKKFNKKVKDHGIFCSCSVSPSSPTLCGSDCSCGMLLSSCSSSCQCRCECTNKPFQQRRIKKLNLVQTEKCGYGIVADEDINPGEFIIEYVGEVIDEKICEERLRKMKHKEETNFYLCQINGNMLIDATYKGNKSRYINHSCNPNAEMQKWIIDGETRIGIFASRYINRGEHLTYDYQFVQFGADQDCYCGAVCCRKKLGAKASKTKSIRLDEAACKAVTRKPPKVKKTRGRHAPGQSRNTHGQRKTCCPNCIGVVIMLARSTNQSSFGIIREFDECSRKHLVMYEDGVTETIDLSREVWKLVNV